MHARVRRFSGVQFFPPGIEAAILCCSAVFIAVNMIETIEIVRYYGCIYRYYTSISIRSNTHNAKYSNSWNKQRKVLDENHRPPKTCQPLGLLSEYIIWLSVLQYYVTEVRWNNTLCLIALYYYYILYHSTTVLHFTNGYIARSLSNLLNAMEFAHLLI